MHRRSKTDCDRRDLLRMAGLSGAGWLTRAAGVLDAKAAVASPREPAQSIIVLWLGGGPSQLETFDPHAGTQIAAGTTAIPTSARGVKIAAGFERLAEQMHHVAVLRTLASKEGDHERGVYALKTGFRPQPTLVHPTVGAIVCHQLPENGIEIPRHISLLPSTRPGWGGYLGGGLDAFQVQELSMRPTLAQGQREGSSRASQARRAPLPDLEARVDAHRVQERMRDLEFLERTFGAGRADLAAKTRHFELVNAARRMMTSEQLAAFDVFQEADSVRLRYGDTPFGRACLAARRLVEQGVRCVEVTLDGWDTHVNNHGACRELVKVLDPAFAALVEDLAQSGQLDRTLVLCGGEFGRTPLLNPLEGRDHWPHNFCFAMAGGQIAGGRAVGETDPQGSADSRGQVRYAPADLHATALVALGIAPTMELHDASGRPIPLSEGQPIDALLA